MKQQYWKDKLKQWKPLVEDKDDPSYSQDTYNAYMLLALSRERGGNRDEVKNDIRAVPEVLTVTPVEAIEGGVQKQLADHFLSTVKLRVRLPRGVDRDILTQQIALDINKMRGVSVRRHTSEIGQELREEDVPYQQRPERQRRLRKGYNRLTKTGPNDSGPFKRMPLDPDWKSAPPGAAGGLEELKIKIRPYGGELITSFEVQPNLNSDIWDGDKMRPEIRERLREIAEEFIGKLDLTRVDIKDIILTGSLANYNWSAYSDLDVHIVIDFRDIAEDEGLVKKYFDAVRSNWNRKHDIKVKGFEVELYVQDDDESHTSTGVYSLLNDEWVLEPSREQREIDKVNIFKKARHIMRDIDKVQSRLDRQEYDGALELGHRVKDKIKRMRSGGLDTGGIYSTENLAFKVLRRGGYMGKLIDALNLAYDAQQSLAEQE
jgi:predicted nucleotidyltransferase